MFLFFFKAQIQLQLKINKLTILKVKLLNYSLDTKLSELVMLIAIMCFYSESIHYIKKGKNPKELTKSMIQPT